MSDKELKRILKQCRAYISSQDWDSLSRETVNNLSLYPQSYPLYLYHALSLSSIPTTPPDKVVSAYEDTIKISPASLQAYLGLAGWLDKKGKQGDAQDVRERAVRNCGAEETERERWAKEVNLWLENERKLRSGRKLAESLSLLLSSSPIYPLLSLLPPPDNTNPTASPYHNLQVTLSNSLPLLEEIIDLHESADTKEIDVEVTKRRQRLTSGPKLSREDERRQVICEVKERSKVFGLYEELLNHPQTSDEQRRDTENKFLKWNMEYLDAIPKTETSKKQELRDRILKMSHDFLLLKIPNEMAWKVVFDWTDFDAYETVDRLQLWDYIGLFPTSPLSKLLRGYMRIFDVAAYEYGAEKDEEGIPEDIEDPTDFIEEGFAGSTECLLGHRLALRYYQEIEQDWDLCIDMAESALELVQNIERESGSKLEKTRNFISRTLGICLAHSERSNQLKALRLIEDSMKWFKNDLEIYIARGQVFTLLERWKEALETFENAFRIGVNSEVREGRGWALVQLERYEEGKEDLINVLQDLDMESLDKEKGVANVEYSGKLPPSKADEMRKEKRKEHSTLAKARVNWKLGKCYWGMGGEYLTNPDYSFQSFVDSIRASPTFAPSFTGLGIYYADIVDPPDFSRSSKCLQKAFELDPREDVAARRLAEQFAEDAEWDLVEVIAKRITEQGRPTAKDVWAWKAMGSADLKKQRYLQASSAFQSVLRINPEDVHSWLNLGISYRHSGKFIAALKSFGKAISLDPTQWYAKFSVGEVQRHMGLLDAAIMTFEDVVKEHPNEIGVQVVLAETRVLSGKALFKQSFLARSEEEFALALQCATKLLSDGLSSRIAWKVAGDALFYLYSFEEQALRSISIGCISSLLTLIKKEDIDPKIPSIDLITVSKVQELLDTITESDLSTSIFMATSVLVHKLRVLLEYHNVKGDAWYDLGQALFQCRNETNENEAIRQAVQCIHDALEKEPLNAGYWNAMGVFTFSNSPQMCQHSFIRSAQLSPRSAIPWTNLGLFYIQHEDIQLANQAFLKAQVLDPEYSLAWVGQSIVALQNDEADQSLPLASHAIALGGVGELDLLYAEQILSSSDAAHRSPDFLTTTSFALSRFISHHPSDSAALHLQGLLSEQLHAYEDAQIAFSRAATLLEALYEENEDPITEVSYAICMYNLGRIHVLLKNWDAAVEALEGAEGLLEEKEDLVKVKRKCGMFLGIAKSMMGSVEEAKESIESVLEGAEGDEKVLLARGFAHATWAAGDKEEAKSILLDLVEHKNLNVATTLAAMALSTDDEILLKASISEFADLPSHIKDAQDPTHEVEKLLGLQGKAEEAMSALSVAIHKSPSSIPLRLELATLLIKSSKIEEAERILPTFEEDMTEWKTDELCEMLRLKHRLYEAKGEMEEQKTVAQKVVRISPGDIENWKLLEVPV